MAEHTDANLLKPVNLQQPKQLLSHPGIPHGILIARQLGAARTSDGLGLPIPAETAVKMRTLDSLGRALFALNDEPTLVTCVQDFVLAVIFTWFTRRLAQRASVSSTAEVLGQSKTAAAMPTGAS